MFVIRQAQSGEYELVREFYYKMIDMVEDAEYHPGWTGFRLYEYLL